MHLYAFIAILVPKIGCRGNAPLSLCMGESQMNSLVAQTLSHNQTLLGYVAYKWRYGHFCDFLPILAKIWLPWQRPLDPCNQKCLLGIGGPQKPPFTVSTVVLNCC